MSPTLTKTIMTIGSVGSAIAAAIPLVSNVPQLAPYVPLFSALSALLIAGAHFKRPGDLSPGQAVAAVSKAVEAEKT